MTMIKLALIGQNISNSLSKQIHESTFNTWGLCGRYDLYDIVSAEVESVLRDLWNQGYLGVNVTAPYKITVANLLKKSSSTPVNTLVRCKGSFWSGISTDSLGLRGALSRLIESGNKPNLVVVLGAGGVLSAVLEACSYLGVKKTHVLSRSGKHIRSIPSSKAVSFGPLNSDYLKSIISGKGFNTLLIQATSAPLFGESLEFLEPALDRFNGYFLDLVYRRPSSLYFLAKRKGIPCQCGLPMLIEQARYSQKAWFGKSNSYNNLKKVLTVSN